MGHVFSWEKKARISLTTSKTNNIRVKPHPGAITKKSRKGDPTKPTVKGQYRYLFCPCAVLVAYNQRI